LSAPPATSCWPMARRSSCRENNGAIKSSATWRKKMSLRGLRVTRGSSTKSLLVIPGSAAPPPPNVSHKVCAT